jgi:para-aminobenzoate synthetase component 1
MQSHEPYVLELAPCRSAVEIFRRLSGLPHCLFLDSARRHPELGCYSYVAADPFLALRVPTDTANPFDELESRLRLFKSRQVAGLPPFQGGAAGIISYDMNRSLERLPSTRYDEFQLPALAVGLFDTVVAFDHGAERAWIISHGFPETDPRRKTIRAKDRAQQFLAWIDSPDKPHRTWQQDPPERIPLSGETFPTESATGLVSNFSRLGFEAAVRQAIEYIGAGDVFQVNLAQRLAFPAIDASVQLYLRLRERNPATFAGYFDLGDYQIVSASPERFLRLADGCVESRPIKGTRQRLAHPEADLFAASELKASDKDIAENVMIVDLMRNDLSRVCEPDSVCVERLCGIERYEYVQHLVSVVSGQLKAGYTVIDLLKASFPGGSITGAPKVRAMEIIAELEPHARGAYCGCLGFIGFDGQMDFNILIRTITAGRGWWQLPVGGGIVAQSDPRQEYEETWHKAEGLVQALRE